MTYDAACFRLAKQILADYRLSKDEREDEAGRLAESIQRVVEMQLENLEHRKIA